MSMPQIHEQTLRDGLMAHPYVPTDVKVELVGRLIDAGIAYLELVRFPLGDDYSQFDDALATLEAATQHRDRATLAVFGMGMAGIDEALAHTGTFHELHVPCFATDAYGQYALGETWSDALQRVEYAQRSASAKGVTLTVGLGTSLGCPIDPNHRLADTLSRFSDLVALGVDCIMLGDTAGKATPAQVRSLLEAVDAGPRPATVRVHLHDTLGRALLNTWTAVEHGVDGVDCSLLGVGGEPHPYFLAPNRVNNGNCATEELVDLLFAARPEESAAWGVSRSRLGETARWLYEAVEGDVFGRAAFAEFVAVGTSAKQRRH